jgi:hypothetical protein
MGVEVFMAMSSVNGPREHGEQLREMIRRNATSLNHAFHDNNSPDNPYLSAFFARVSIRRQLWERNTVTWTAGLIDPFAVEQCDCRRFG